MIRTTRSWSVAAAAIATGLTLAACGTTDDSSNDTASGQSGGDCNATIAFLGPQTGDYANLGINITNGMKVALDEYNAKDPKCTVKTQAYDSQGDPEKASPLAVQIINDDSVVGVVGPTFSGESDATGEAFNEAGLVTVSASATNPELTTHGWTTFHRILGNDLTQAPKAAQYIKENLGAKKVFVVDDASEYGKGIGDIVRKDLGDLVVGNDTVQQKQTDFSPSVTKVKASGADTLFYGGYYPEAGLFVKQLRAGGWKGTFVSGDGSNDPGFVEAAGAQAAEGAILTCPCVPASGDFAKTYTDTTGQEPGTYSAEGYDAMNLYLQGLDAGDTDRDSMLDWVTNYDQPGLTKTIKFEKSGEVADVKIWAYKVTNGKIVGETEIK